MEKRKRTQKLTLSLETLRQLDPQEVRPAAGGCTSGTLTAGAGCTHYNTICVC